MMTKIDWRKGITRPMGLEKAIQYYSERVIFKEVDLSDLYRMSSMFPIETATFRDVYMEGNYAWPRRLDWHRAVQIAVKKALGIYRGEFKGD